MYKNQLDFLFELENALKYLPKTEKEKVIYFYTQKINTRLDYGEDEEQIVNSFGDVEKIAEEVYKSHGVDYQEKAKKKMKINSTLKLIIDIILSIFVVLSFGVIFYLIIRLITTNVSLLSFINKTNTTSLDKTLTSLISISFGLVVLFLSVYVLDLGIILIDNLFIPHLKIGEEKIRKAKNFSLTALINEKLKIKHFFLLASLIFFVLAILLSIVSFNQGGYLKRSLKELPLNTEEIILDDNLTEFRIDAGNADVEIYIADQNIIELSYEFQKPTITDTSIKIASPYTFDIFGLLSEPTPKIKISLKENTLNTLNLDINGKLVLNDFNLNNLSLNINSSTKLELAINNIYLANLNIVTNELDADIKSCEFALDLNTDSGSIDINDSNITTSSITATRANTIIGKSHFTSLEFASTSGTYKFEKSIFDNLTINQNASNSYLNDSQIGTFNLSINSTGLLSTSKLEVDTLVAKVKSGAYLILDEYRGTLATIDANNANIFVSEASLDNLSIVHQSTKSKLEVYESTINDLNIQQTGGYLNVEKCTLTDANLILTKISITDLIDNDGGVCYLSLANLQDDLQIKGSSALEYKVVAYDAKSYAVATIEGANVSWKKEA